MPSTDSHTLYLASRSPRRQSLIKLLGIHQIEVMPSDIQEEFLSDLTPEQNVVRIALDKARSIAAKLSDGVVLGADTTVVIDGDMLNKPRDPHDAIDMLERLSGNTHTVYTGVALIDSQTKVEQTFSEATHVTFRPLNREEIEAYVATGSPLDKAGAYGIQEDFGAVFVSRIEGDYYNVVGLPISKLYTALRAFAPQLFLL
jgi:septum formation protein